MFVFQQISKRLDTYSFCSLILNVSFVNSKIQCRIYTTGISGIAVDGCFHIHCQGTNYYGILYSALMRFCVSIYAHTPIRVAWCMA